MGYEFTWYCGLSLDTVKYNKNEQKPAEVPHGGVLSGDEPEANEGS